MFWVVVNQRKIGRLNKTVSKAATMLGKPGRYGMTRHEAMLIATNFGRSKDKVIVMSPKEALFLLRDMQTKISDMQAREVDRLRKRKERRLARAALPQDTRKQELPAG
jgi:hypothetical protein